MSGSILSHIGDWTVGLLDAASASAREAGVTGGGPHREIIVNGFRSPSMGFEFLFGFISIHAGFYPTIISKDRNGENETTWFFKTGFSLWLFPFASNSFRPSGAFISVSHVLGRNKEWAGDHGLLLDGGFRWLAWEGLQLRLGGCILLSRKHPIRINPTPGIGWSFLAD